MNRFHNISIEGQCSSGLSIRITVPKGLTRDQLDDLEIALGGYTRVVR